MLLFDLSFMSHPALPHLTFVGNLKQKHLTGKYFQPIKTFYFLQSTKPLNELQTYLKIEVNIQKSSNCYLQITISKICNLYINIIKVTKFIRILIMAFRKIEILSYLTAAFKRMIKTNPFGNENHVGLHLN